MASTEFVRSTKRFNVNVTSFTYELVQNGFASNERKSSIHQVSYLYVDKGTETLRDYASRKSLFISRLYVNAFARSVLQSIDTFGTFDFADVSCHWLTFRVLSANEQNQRPRGRVSAWSTVSWRHISGGKAKFQPYYMKNVTQSELGPVPPTRDGIQRVLVRRELR